MPLVSRSGSRGRGIPRDACSALLAAAAAAAGVGGGGVAFAK